MEPHPVPQNVLDVEFKLFGAFSLREFTKVVIGGIIALVIFILLPDQIWYLKYPLIVISLLLGVGVALVPNLGVWLTSFVKALFVSPRYVWEKESRAPESLTTDFSQKVVNENLKVASANKKKATFADSDEISLERLLDASTPGIKGLTTTQFSVFGSDHEPKDPKLEKLLAQVYSNQNKKTNQAPVANTKTGKVPVQNSQNAASVRQKSNQDYLREINTLKQELNSLVKDQNYKEKESAILEKIADLYQEIKFLEGGVAAVNTPIQQKRNVTNEKGAPVDVAGQIVFGLIVDRNTQPVSGGVVAFKDSNMNVIASVNVSSDGRFATPKQLPAGTYNVQITHPELQFNSYKIDIGNAKLPAYRFRSR